MDADFGVEQDEEDDEEEDLSREEFFTPSSLNMSVRTLGSRASSGKAGETPYFSAAATAAAYRAMSRSLVPGAFPHQPILAATVQHAGCDLGKGRGCALF
jgi:hypothetical protein